MRDRKGDRERLIERDRMREEKSETDCVRERLN